MSETEKAWPAVLDQIFEGFRSVENVAPEWLEVPGTGRRPRVDILYPDLDIAIWFKGAQSTSPWDGIAPDQVYAALRRPEGTLVVIDSDVDPHGQTWAEICTALSAAARRIAQQLGSHEAKLDLLPHIAEARARCQRLQSEMSAPLPGRGSRPSQQSPRRTQVGQHQQAIPWYAGRWQIPDREDLMGLGTVLASGFGILRRIALLLLVLLGVNAVSYLVANFLDLRGPMAYNYVPDTKVPIADVVAPYPDYLRSALQGDFGMMRQNELRGMLFSQQQIPIIELVLQRLPRSLLLLGVAMLIAIGVGITAGFLSVNYKTKRTNPLALVLSLAGFSMPGFYMGILILYLMIWLAMNHGKGVFFLPTTGFGLDEHLILPALALAARPTAEIARLTAELLSEELPKDYINVARAKGLPERWVVMRHAFRNVVSAVINAMSNSWSYVIGSLVIIERVFAWGGIGEALIDAVTFSQFAGSSFNPALVATLATALALLWLLADLITGSIAQVVDPRLRRTQGGAA